MRSAPARALEPPRVMPAPPSSDVGVISLVSSHWEDAWMPRHQVATRLARRFHTVWVDLPLDWRKAFAERRRGSVEHHSSGLLIYRHSALLPHFYRPHWLARGVERARLYRARRLLLDRGCRRIVLYLWWPRFAPALELLPHDLSIYHIDDEYSFSTNETPNSPEEVALISRADQVIVHSPALLEKKGNINPRTALIPNGVDYRAFSTPAAEPSDLRAVPRPRIGYVGVIKTQLDLEKLLELAQRNPAWSFVFVGPFGFLGGETATVDALRARANVYFLGNKAVAELPGYAQHMDVCTMCYKVNDYTKYIYPLKLHEYLATGRPVVATPIRTLQDFAGTIALANTTEEWEAAIRDCLESTPDRAAARQATARTHDWDVLVQSIGDLIMERLAEARPADAPLRTLPTPNRG